MGTGNSTPGQDALRRGRWSLPSASYFITACTRDRKAGLAAPGIFCALLGIAEALQSDEAMSLRVMTLMPDHLHAVIRLGLSAPLSAVMRLFKGRSSVALRQYGLAWQKGGFYDHRLRADEPQLPVFHYIFMNPYRRGLCSPNERWPYFFCCDDDRQWCEPGMKGDVPCPEWLPPPESRHKAAPTS